MKKCEYENESGDKKSSVNETKIVRWTQKPLVRQMIVSSCICASFFQVGLFFGACTVVIAQLRRRPLSDGVYIDDEKASWISSMGGFAGIPCVLLLGLMGEYLGRKLSYMFVCVATCASFVVFYCASSYKTLILAQILQGPLTGGGTNICFMIASECIAPKYRGISLSVQSSTSYWGVWIANAVGTFFHWKNICIIGIACAVYNTFMITICPESPFWLASKGKFKKCKEAHRWLRGTDEVAEKELQCMIESEVERSRNIREGNNLYQRLILHPKKIFATEFYKPLGLCILMSIFFHLSGKNVLSMYAIDIIKKITKSESAAFTGMLILDGITVLGMYIGSVMTIYTKRRTLFFSTEFAAIFFLFVISLYLYLIKQGSFQENVYVSISFLLAFSLCISCGPVILYASLVSEILPLKLRTLAAMLQCLAANIIGSCSMKLAPWIFSSFGTYGAFLFFAVVSLVCALILLKYLPETKNKTLEQIENLFKKEVESTEMKKILPLANRACAEKGVDISASV